jgi:hypothetical protein
MFGIDRRKFLCDFGDRDLVFSPSRTLVRKNLRRRVRKYDIVLQLVRPFEIILFENRQSMNELLDGWGNLE